MTARALGAVAFAAIGAVLVVTSSSAVMASELGRDDVLCTVLGLALLLGARGLAALVLPAEPDVHIDRVAAQNLHTLAFAIVGLCGTLLFLWQMLEPMLRWALDLDLDGTVPTQLAQSLPPFVISLLLLGNSGALARLWWRAQRVETRR